MKQKTIKTNKGKFLIVDNPHETKVSFALALLDIKDFDNVVEITEIGNVKDLTEEQCSKVVDHSKTIYTVKDRVYQYVHYEDKDDVFPTATQSFRSLLRSKNVLLYNKYDNTDERFTTREPFCIKGMRPCLPENECTCKLWKDTEELVYKNPYLFKLKEA